MSLTADNFEQFVIENSEAIKQNLNLGDGLLNALWVAKYIEKSTRQRLEPYTLSQRHDEFIQILTDQPGDYMKLAKTTDLIQVLGNRNHPRPEVQKIFISWKNRLEDSLANLSSQTDSSSSSSAITETRQEAQNLSRQVLQPQAPPRGSNEVPKSPPPSKQQDLQMTGAPSDVSEVFPKASGPSGGANVQFLNTGKVDQINIFQGSGNTANNTGNRYYINTAISNGTLNWIVDGVKAKTVEHLDELVAQSESPGQSAGGKAFKKGQTLYVNWRYDNWRWKWNRVFDSRYKPLKSASVDQEEVATLFQDLTNYVDEEDFLLKENLTKTELEQAIKSFKDQIKPETDYIVVVLNVHGCNRTQLVTDDLEAVDLFQDIVWQLDFANFKGLAEDKPRLYLVNACQDYSKFYASEALKKKEDPKFLKHHSSPYFIFFATQPEEESYASTSKGSIFYRAIYQDGFSENAPMHHMIEKVQENVDKLAAQWKVKQTTTVMHSSKFKPHQFNFTAEKSS